MYISDKDILNVYLDNKMILNLRLIVIELV